jgi:adenylosuccinate synthase
MPVIAVIGAQWGDEGKGKIVDLLARQSDVVVRFSGGDNAGHTVLNDRGEFKLHLVPSGIFSSRAVCIMGNGMAINPAVLLGELDDLNKRGVDTSRLFISDRAHLIMPYHLVFDGIEEELRGGKAIGTTRKGIGPVYSDKIARLGIRAGDLLDRAAFKERLDYILEVKNAILTKVYGKEAFSLDEIYRKYSEYGDRLKKYICDTGLVLEEAFKSGKTILMEGAQGFLLDPDFGTYPYVTSSAPVSAGACLGSGLSPFRLKRAIGIFKAYCTRVGGGPMPTELNDETGSLIRERGHEYGTTTGRPRRCGWFDAVLGRYSTRINGFNGAVITRLDILDTLPEVKICTGYKIKNKKIENVPFSAGELEKCVPVYETMPGWQCPTSDIRNYKDLPLAARQYVSRVEQLIDCPINIISVGAKDEQTIKVSTVF